MAGWAATRVHTRAPFHSDSGGACFFLAHITSEIFRALRDALRDCLRLQRLVGGGWDKTGGGKEDQAETGDRDSGFHGVNCGPLPAHAQDRGEADQQSRCLVTRGHETLWLMRGAQPQGLIKVSGVVEVCQSKPDSTRLVCDRPEPPCYGSVWPGGVWGGG